MGKKEEKKTKEEKAVVGKKERKGTSPISLLAKVLLITGSIFLIILIVWFGYSFFTLTRGDPLGYPTVDRGDDKLAEMVTEEVSNYSGNSVEFYYTVVLYQVSSEQDVYSLYLYAYDFINKYDDIEDAKFVYNLDKDKERGRFDFDSLEWGEPVNIIIRYRLDKDIRYFLEYSMYTFKKAFPSMFPEQSDIFLSYDYLVERGVNSWEIKAIESGETE